MAKRLVDELASGLRVDPSKYSAVTSNNRMNSLMFALSGCLYMLRYQKNTRIMALASILALILALWLQVAATQLAVVLLSVSAVWIAEFINAAVEAVVNVATADCHPMAKVAKDIAAAAVLVAALWSVPIGVLILGPPLLEKLQFLRLV